MKEVKVNLSKWSIDAHQYASKTVMPHTYSGNGYIQFKEKKCQLSKKMQMWLILKN